MARGCWEEELMRATISQDRRSTYNGKSPEHRGKFSRQPEENTWHPRHVFQRKPNIFCVGRNKTGMTSLETALRSLGFKIAPQARAELLTPEWARRDFASLIRFCRKYDAFQDVPFSLDFTYVAFDQAFPGSRFILTERDNAQVWYESMVRFSAKLLGVTGVPTVSDLANFEYRSQPARKGELLRRFQLVYDSDTSKVFDRNLLIAHYENHNRSVRNYFRHRPKDLLILNLKEPDAMERLCHFVGRPYNGESMPHENMSG